MTKYIKEFIEDNIELVETGDWNKLAELCNQNYLKKLAVYLNLADISANFEIIEYSPDTTLSISAFYHKNKLTQEAKLELDVQRYDPSYISTFSTENYSEIKASGLKTFINDFIDMLNKKYSTDFQKF